MKITQEYLKSLLHYNPETGVFTWIADTFNTNAGDVAGCIRTSKKAIKSYIILGLNGKRYLAHRIAWIYMTGSLPNIEIDHIDGNGCNNKWVNLRDVSHLENGRNIKLKTNNKSSICGVRWYPRYSKWHSQIQINYKQKHLGYFDSLLDAVCARKNAEVKYGFHKNHGSNRPL